jgi:hypothetical protein
VNLIPPRRRVDYKTTLLTFGTWDQRLFGHCDYWPDFAAEREKSYATIHGSGG